jgi:hypothetical protein
MWTDTDVRHDPRLLEALRTAPGDLTSSQIQLLMEEGRRQRAAWFGRALGRLLGRGRRRDTMPGEVAAAARS